MNYIGTLLVLAVPLAVAIDVLITGFHPRERRIHYED